MKEEYMKIHLKQKGRKLTHMLRHAPEKYGVNIDNAGWVPVWEVLQSLKLDLDELSEIVKNDNKNRFTLKGGKIRANQGHSININLGLEPTEPPLVLYHGTVQKYIKWIKKEGLKKMSRLHVHLSADLQTAIQVANRRETNNVILEIDAKGMYNDGYEFFLSDNGVWLTDHVPVSYITF